MSNRGYSTSPLYEEMKERNRRDDRRKKVDAALINAAFYMFGVITVLLVIHLLGVGVIIRF